MMQTTLRRIRAADPCGMQLEDGQRVGYLKLRHHLGKGYGDDTPVDIATIIASNGLGDAMWCLRTVDGHAREMRLYAVWCARLVQHLMEDPRSVTALEVAERYANGAASDDELAAARDAARYAARDAAGYAALGAAWDAAWDAAWYASSAASTARAAQAAELQRICAEIAACRDPYPAVGATEIEAREVAA